MKRTRSLHIAQSSDVISTISQNHVTTVNKLCMKSFHDVSNNIFLNFHQNSSGHVPRSYLQSVLHVSPVKSSYPVDAFVFKKVLEQSLQWYLDNGGRISRLTVYSSSPSIVEILSPLLGAEVNVDQNLLKLLINDVNKDAYHAFNLDPHKAIEYCMERVLTESENQPVLYDILGRLYHDIGQPASSIDYYTKSLQIDSSSSALLRNMGSAYHAIGNVQMAFASYQQALQVNNSDYLVYLKLALLYEEFASQDYIEAANNAESSYRYYLSKVDSGDTTVLTRLGNLLLREHKDEAALDVFEQIISLDATLHNVWFNKAHAELKLRRYSDAENSLRKTIALNSNIIAAHHMLKALSDEESYTVTKTEESYVKELYRSYSSTYDEHGKKLLYSAPRVIRQEMGNIYKARRDGSLSSFSLSVGESEINILPPLKKATMTPAGTCSDHPMEAPSNAACVDGSSGSHDPSQCEGEKSFMSEQLDILDLGCGTGQSGAWLKDYAKSLSGVDISEEMVAIAKKKAIYDDLKVDSLSNFLSAMNSEDHKQFDLVVAADVLSYIGDLSEVTNQVSGIVRPGGHFVFTVETSADENSFERRGFRLQRNGRFGYSKEYLDNLITLMGDDYKVVMSRPYSTRLDAGEPVPGFLYIVERQ